MNESIQVNGEMAGKNDIIRSLKTIPENRVFADWNNKVDPKISRIIFEDGNALMQTPATEPSSTELLLVNKRSFLIDFVIDPKTFMGLISSLGKRFIVQNTDDLKTTIINCLEYLTIKAYNAFMDIVSDFVKIYGDKIQHDISRIIPYELFLSDVFKVFNLEAILQSTDLSKYITNTLRPTAYASILQFYKQFRPKRESVKTCKTCGGIYYNSVTIAA